MRSTAFVLAFTLASSALGNGEVLAKDDSIIELSQAVLYEQSPDQPEGARFVGSIAWRTEPAGDESGIVARADIEIPQRHLVITWVLRKNDDKAIPASHLVDVKFRLPLDFDHRGIQALPGLLMKQTEETRGSPLIGRATKLEDNHFQINLSAAETDAQRNIRLLKELGRIDLPFVYDDGQRAILMLEKGAAGERAFADGFAQWRQ